MDFTAQSRHVCFSVHMISALPCLVEPLLSAEENNSVHVLFGLLQALNWLQEIFLKRHEYADISQVSFHDLVWWKVTGFEWNAKGIVGTANIWYTPENRPPLSLCCIMILVRRTSVLYYNAHGQGQRDVKHYASSISWWRLFISLHIIQKKKFMEQK